MPALMVEDRAGSASPIRQARIEVLRRPEDMEDTLYMVHMVCDILLVSDAIALTDRFVVLRR